MNLLTRYDQIPAVNLKTMFPGTSSYEKEIQNKRVMVLCDDVGIYKYNILAGYFPDWGLSQPLFEKTDYFENIVLINGAFQTDPPEVIVDPKDYMKKVIERIPGIKSKYRRDGELYKRISN